MVLRSRERKGIVRDTPEGRMVLIPDVFVLAGKEITIRQERDGAITIHPASEEDLRAMEIFNPVVDEGDWEGD